MSEADRLDQIKALHEAFLAFAPGAGLFLNVGLPEPVAQFLEHAGANIDWLIGEVQDRRTDLAMALTQVRDLRTALAERDQQVKRLQEVEERLHEAQLTIGKLSHAMSDHEVARLRGRLRQLEWAAPDCPACGAPGPGTVGPGITSGRHEPNCWFAAELGTTDHDTRTQ